ncbi:unnamed protein product [Ilex paraguariensis]|uniref:IST1-like protein n=1 Tax=Ilex paraguariensis TaxID=185542 RepID=A0ABC8S6G4_9AQUA
MLHRSFKPAKCKTALRLATSRIKLLKNKKDVQLKQMKKELAQLLESGQEQTARIRVEHVVREEKMKAAYDLIEIYCELIATRLPIIESQKNCPIDLKEAVTSVVFASPRCADIPELLDIKKHFTAKYGKEFISAAVELRPECGVSRMLVEKLSAVAPDGQTKIKILGAIAEEHNIKWDPKSFGDKESKPADDLLNGPNTFEKASKMLAEPNNFQAPSAQAPPSHDQKPPLNFSEQNPSSSMGVQNFASTDTSGLKTPSSATSHSEARPSEGGAERMEVRQPCAGDDNAFSLGRQNWNMEFKDAISAAQAAAESAERASMAARAAAELSTRDKITRQYSSESQKSNPPGLRDGGCGKYAASNLPGVHHPKNLVNNSSIDRNKFLNEQMDGIEHNNLAGAAERFYQNDHASTTRSSRLDSLQSNKPSIDDDSLVNNLHTVDRYPQKDSCTEEADKGSSAGMTMKKESTESAVEFGSEWKDGFRFENLDHSSEERTRKQSSSISSHSRLSAFQDGYNVSDSNQQEFRNNVDEDSFVNISNQQEFRHDADDDSFVNIDQESIHKDTVQTSSSDNDAAIFDEPGSDDDDDSRFDIGPRYDEPECNSYFPSPGRNSSTLFSTSADTWSPRSSTRKSVENYNSQTIFSARRDSSLVEGLGKSLDQSQPDHFAPVSYDSDGQDSDSEDELDISRLGGKKDFKLPPLGEDDHSINRERRQSESHGSTRSSLLEKVNSGSDRMGSDRMGQSESPGSTRSSLVEKGNLGPNRKPRLRSSYDDSNSLELRPRNTQGTESNASSFEKIGFADSSAHQPSLRLGKSQWELNDVSSELSSYSPEDEGNTKQYLQSSRISLVHEVKDSIRTPESPDTLKDNEFFNQSSPESEKGLNFGTLTGGLRNKGYTPPPYTRRPSSNTSSLPMKAAEDTSTMIEQSNASATVKNYVDSGASTKVDEKSSSRVRLTHSYSDSDDSAEEFPQETPSGRRQPYSQKVGKDVNTKSSLRASVTYFSPDTDSGDFEEDLPRQTFSSRARLGAQFSRRTKPSPETISHSRARAGSKTSVNSDFTKEEKPTRSSDGAETTPKLPSQTVKSDQWGSSEQPISAKQAASNPLPESKVSSSVESLKSSVQKQPSSSLLKTVPSDSNGNPKTSTSSGEIPSRENSINKASHVHPKLPDYDTITAHLLSLRTNRQ